jgi:hypothetical protein
LKGLSIKSSNPSDGVLTQAAEREAPQGFYKKLSVELFYKIIPTLWGHSEITI